MAIYVATFFEDVSYERPLVLLLSSAERGMLQRTGFRGQEKKQEKSCCYRKIHEQKT